MTLVATPNISEVTMDIWQMQNGLIYIMSSGSGTNLWVHDPSTGSTTLLVPSIPGFPLSMYGLTDSTLLIHTANGLYSYNINQNTNTFLGPLTPLYNGEIFEYNGQLYAQNIGYMYELDNVTTKVKERSNSF
jgi:outer membrane protein assembly factor BamB